MAVLKNLSNAFYVKRRPKAYASDGMIVGGNRGWVLSSLPRAYPATPQQKKVRQVAQECGIRKGISRSELRKAMTTCVRQKMSK